MAAIDKLYVHSFYEFDQIRRWALVYYPKLILYMYDFDLSYNEFVQHRKNWVKNEKKVIEREYAKLGDFKTLSDAIYHLQAYYKEKIGYECPYEQAKDEVEYCISMHSKKDDELEGMYTFPVTNTPLDIDRKLKWICPVPCVRKYLYEQCGVNPKWEWLYKIFWKGKKHF